MSSPQEYLAALTPARDRRLHARTAPSSPAYILFGNASRGIVHNISETGMAVAAAGLPVAGDYLPRICVQLPGSRQSIEMSAQVVWQAESQKCAGIRFVVLSPDARAQISNWIASETPIPEFEQLLKLPHREEQPSEFKSRKSGRIFSHPSVLDEEASARYAEIFPSENTTAKPINKISEIEAPISPAPISELSPTNAVDSKANRVEVAPSPFHVFELSAVQVAALIFLFAVIGLAVGLAAITTSFDVWSSAGRGSLGKRAHSGQASSPSSGSGDTISQTTTPPAADTLNTPAVVPPSPNPIESRSESPSAQSRSAQAPDSAASPSPIGSSPVTSPSRTDSDDSSRANKLPGAAPLDKKSRENSWDSNFFAKSAPTYSSPATEPKPAPKSATIPERHDVTGPVARNAPPPATPNSAHSAVAVGPANPKSLAKASATDSNSSPAKEFRPAAKPATSSERHAATGSVARSAPPPANPKPAHTSKPVGPTNAVPKNPAPSTAAPAKIVASKPTPPPESPKPAPTSKAVGPTIAAPKNPAPPTAAPAKSAAPKPSPKPLPPPPPASPEPALSAKSIDPPNVAPKNPAPPTAAPATGAFPKPTPKPSAPPSPATPGPAHAAAVPGPAIVAPKIPAPLAAAPATPMAPDPSAPSANLLAAPAENSKPVRMVFPQKRIAASSSLEITTQLSVLVPPEPGSVATPPRLQAAKLVSYVLPRNPRPGDRYGAEETVKLHATIGQLGQVTDVRPVSGPIFLLSSATSAVRLWRYKPTLLNGRPVEAQQDVTIIFQLPR